MNKFKRLFLNRLYLFALLALIEVAALVWIIFILFYGYAVGMGWSLYIYYGLFALRIVLLFYLLYIRETEFAFKAVWIMIIMIEPFFGMLFYIMFAGRKPVPVSRTNPYLIPFSEGRKQDADVMNKLGTISPNCCVLSDYIYRNCNSKVCDDAEIKIFTPCDEVCAELAALIEKAEKYVFIEMFIISSGYFLDTLLDAIEKNPALQVYVLSDGVGSYGVLKDSDVKRMKKLKVRFAYFNKLKLLFGSTVNYRNHRKLIVIDGKTAFTGGMNIADEYINRISRFGYWFDALVQVSGGCVDSFVNSFIQDWQFATGKKLEFESFAYAGKSTASAGELAQYYFVNPIDSEPVAENVLLSIIQNATEYVYISTPYLVLNDIMVNTLKVAAKSGVDIRIIIPGIPDKKYVYVLSTYYAERLSAQNVKVFTYDKGFLHAKFVLSDDKIVNISSVNLDYRSFYLNFEAGLNIYGRKTALHMKNVFDRLFAESHPVEVKKAGALRRTAIRIVKIFSVFF